MKKIIIIFLLGCLSSLTFAADGIIEFKSKFGVAHTADRFVGIVRNSNINVMAHIKHSEGAKRAGIDIKPTELIIFGNPKIGAPMMACERSIAIDLPQKLLIWEDDNGQVWMSYNDPTYIANRHGLQDECRGSLEKLANALRKFSHKAGGID